VTVKIHHKQWLITRDAKLPTLQPKFRTMELGAGTFLHYEASLSVTRVNGSGCESEIVVLGLLLGDQPDRGCGRFVVVRYPWLNLDATGTMGVFYFKKPITIICSSSTSLISEVSGSQVQGRELRWEEGINWDPLPGARIAGLRKLFCDQVLDLRTGHVSTRTVPFAPRIGGRLDGVAEELAEYLHLTVQQLAGLDRPIFLGLTAGRDSRTLFSALLHCKVRFEAFTLHRGKNIGTDAQVAGGLCEKYGIRHRLLVSSSKPRFSELDNLKRHTAGTEGDAAKEDVLGDYYRDLPSNAIVLHGGVFELGRRYYENRLKSVKFAASREVAEGIASAFGESSRSVLAPLRAWYRYRRRYPIEGMDYVDLFYLDQRRGGWGAANQQAQDSFGPDQVILANSWKAISLLMSTPANLRRKAVIQMRAAEILLPGITTIMAINPMGAKEKIKKTLVNVVSRYPFIYKSLQEVRKRLRAR
jgi:hypothetical protein